MSATSAFASAGEGSPPPAPARFDAAVAEFLAALAAPGGGAAGGAR